MTSSTPGLSDSIDATWLARLLSSATGKGQLPEAAEPEPGGRLARKSRDAHAHVAALGGNVDLEDVLALEDRLRCGSRSAGRT